LQKFDINQIFTFQEKDSSKSVNFLTILMVTATFCRMSILRMQRTVMNG